MCGNALSKEQSTIGISKNTPGIFCKPEQVVVTSSLDHKTALGNRQVESVLAVTSYDASGGGEYDIAVDRADLKIRSTRRKLIRRPFRIRKRMNDVVAAIDEYLVRIVKE